MEMTEDMSTPAEILAQVREALRDTVRQCTPHSNCDAITERCTAAIDKLDSLERVELPSGALVMTTREQE
jgi:hypothetical protein